LQLLLNLMEHFFSLPVQFKGEALSFPARLITFGHSFKFYVMVDKTELTFEKDDEGQYRVLREGTGPEMDRALLEAIILSLEDIQR